MESLAMLLSLRCTLSRLERRTCSGHSPRPELFERRSDATDLNPQPVNGWPAHVRQVDLTPLSHYSLLLSLWRTRKPDCVRVKRKHGLNWWSSSDLFIPAMKSIRFADKWVLVTLSLTDMPNHVESIRPPAVAHLDSKTLAHLLKKPGIYVGATGRATWMHNE